MIRGAESIDYFRRREGLHDGDRPGWGQTARDMGEDVPEESAHADMMAQLRARMRMMQEE